MMGDSKQREGLMLKLGLQGIVNRNNRRRRFLARAPPAEKRTSDSVEKHIGDDSDHEWTPASAPGLKRGRSSTTKHLIKQERSSAAAAAATFESESSSESDDYEGEGIVVEPDIAFGRDDRVMSTYEGRIRLSCVCSSLSSKWEEYEKRVQASGRGEKSNDVAFDGGSFFIPSALNTKLYRYQRDAVEWIYKLHQANCGGILADQMGLGKTIETIGFLASLHYSSKLSPDSWSLGGVLIVCPATLMRQWLDELHKWWPPFRVVLLHGSACVVKSSVSHLASLFNKSGHVMITSYTTFLKQSDSLTKVNWDYVILDEGHKIRNPDAQITLACKKLSTPHRLILSGSPIQNNLRELWSVFDFVHPGRLGRLQDFMDAFAIPITSGGYSNASHAKVQAAYRCACVLRDTIKPNLLRRLKADVRLELPTKSEQVLFCQLTEHQRDVYKEYLCSRQCEDILTGRFKVFVGLIVLRKLCNHPDLVTGGPDVHPSTTTATGDELSFGHWSRSAKMQVLGAVLRMWRKQGHRALVFTQSRQMLSIIESFVISEEHSYYLMDGTTAMGSRQNLIRKFNEDGSVFLFLLTTRVGGLGVNLVGANRVIIFDPDWNPSTDMQARERVWRIGQSRNVTVYRLLTVGTIEEKIYHRQIFKQFLTNRILVDARQTRFFKSNDLLELFTLAGEPPPSVKQKSRDKRVEEKLARSTETEGIFAGLDIHVKVDTRSREGKGDDANVGDTSSAKLDEPSTRGRARAKERVTNMWDSGSSKGTIRAATTAEAPELRQLTAPPPASISKATLNRLAEASGGDMDESADGDGLANGASERDSTTMADRGLSEFGLEGNYDLEPGEIFEEADGNELAVAGVKAVEIGVLEDAVEKELNDLEKRADTLRKLKIPKKKRVAQLSSDICGVSSDRLDSTAVTSSPSETTLDYDDNEEDDLLSEADKANMRRLARKLAKSLGSSRKGKLDALARSESTSHASSDRIKLEPAALTHKPGAKFRDGSSKKRIPLLVKQEAFKRDTNEDSYTGRAGNAKARDTPTTAEDESGKQDDYVLRKLLRRTNVQTALRHDTIMDSSRADYAIIESEAILVAKSAADSLRESRRRYREDHPKMPVSSVFGNENAIRGGVSSRLVPSSSSLLDIMRKRNNMAAPMHSSSSSVEQSPKSKAVPAWRMSSDSSAARNPSQSPSKRQSQSTEPSRNNSLNISIPRIKHEPSLSSAAADVPAPTAKKRKRSKEKSDLSFLFADESLPVVTRRSSGDSPEMDTKFLEGPAESVAESDEPKSALVAELLDDLRVFIAYGASRDGRATTEEIRRQFKDRVGKDQVAVFRALLQEICEKDKNTNSNTITWTLKPEFS